MKGENPSLIELQHYVHSVRGLQEKDGSFKEFTSYTVQGATALSLLHSFHNTTQIVIWGCSALFVTSLTHVCVYKMGI